MIYKSINDIKVSYVNVLKRKNKYVCITKDITIETINKCRGIPFEKLLMSIMNI